MKMTKTFSSILEKGKEYAEYPAFDELLSFSLERRHLETPEFSKIFFAEGEENKKSSLLEHLKQNVRMMKVEEFSFDSNEPVHLPGVESAITSMRQCGCSLLFMVQGTSSKVSVFMGIARFIPSNLDLNSILNSYASAWKANFPGTQFKNLTADEILTSSGNLSNCKEFGVLTGIPSLKREEDSNSFVQGLERLIRAMRGKVYCWISIADPIPQALIRNSIDACQVLLADVHRLVYTDLQDAVSKGGTVTLGMFASMGQGTTDGSSHTDSYSKTTTNSDTHTQNKMENYQRVEAVATPVLAIAGGAIGLLLGGPVGAAIGGTAGSMAGKLIGGIGAYKTGKNGFSDSITNAISETQGWADTASHALSKQVMGGGFGSISRSWTNTTNVGQELLNRKAEYIEELLKSYEKRLHEGDALGMWNLGHYFCAGDEETYSQGIGVVTSLFTGMDSTYEPPRAIKMPEKFRDILRRFNNVYLHFSKIDISTEKLNKIEKVPLVDHPLGFIFNGPCTPVNTKELAVATPIAKQDIEGVSVSERARFGINIVQHTSEKSLTVGQIMDKGNILSQCYHLSLENLSKHLAVFGLTGSGKTNTIHHLLIQLWKNHRVPFLVIEPAKAEYRALATADELKDDLLVISAGIDQSGTCPLRMNPFYFTAGSDNDAHRVHVLTHIDRLKATFNASFPMYASMPYILEEAILEIYRERGWDLGLSKNRYIDIYHEDYSSFIPTMQDLFLKVDSIVKKKGYFQEQQMNIQAALKARLSSLMVGSKGNMFNCLHSIPAKEMFGRPTIIELENMGDDDEKAFLMGLLVSKLYEYRKTVESSREKLQHVLVIEEAHRLLTNTPDSSNMEVANVKGKAVSAFVDMLSEIRAYGQSVIIVDQLPSRISPNAVKGTGAKIVHRLLAKDDRESVGWTMGMNDEQINDLSLLRTGECVVSQDGDRKAFLCQVQKNELHEKRSGGEISIATTRYKQKNATLFEIIPDEIDYEDVNFHDELYSAMIAVGCGQSSNIISSVKPLYMKKMDSKFPIKTWQKVYWDHICREIWGYFGGDYSKLISLHNLGEGLLTNPSSDSKPYRKAFENYYVSTKQYLYSPNTSLAGTAFSHLLALKRCFESLNRYFDSIKNASNIEEKTGIAIQRVMPQLVPHSFVLDTNILENLIAEIVIRIAPDLSVSKIVGVAKGGEK